MPFYSSKNAPLLLNRNKILCSEVSLQHSAQTVAVYHLGDRSTRQYAAQNGIQGQCNFTYFMTGHDFIRDLIATDADVSGVFGGISFGSGKLRSYSVTCTPNEPVAVNASIVFFDQLSGAFNPSAPTPISAPSLNFSDATLTHLTNYSVETLTNVLGVSYAYEAQVEPIYTIDESVSQDITRPSRIVFGKKTITTEITCDSLDTIQPIQGKKAGVKLNFNHPNYPNLSESLLSSGVMNQKTVRSTVGDSVVSQIQIIQDSADAPPFIDSFSPTTVSAGGVVTVLGKNFTTATSAFIGQDTNGQQTLGFDVVDDGTITFTVGTSQSGPITIRNLWGTATSTSTLTVNSDPITVLGGRFAASPGDVITIDGANFNNITNITFGGVSSPNFSLVTTSQIRVEIPQGPIMGPLRIGSNTSLQTGDMGFHFIFPPVITGFTPTSGVSGTSVRISGYNFSGVSNVFFNRIPAVSFTINSNILITATCPSGNVLGPLLLTGVSGFTGVSSGQFFPYLLVTGCSPLSGLPYSNIQISGSNFDSGILYNYTGQLITVLFNGVPTGFSWCSRILITGMVPSGDVSGPIQFLGSDGVSRFNTNFTWTQYLCPTIYTGNITGIASGQILNTLFSGVGLAHVTGIKFSGVSSNNAGSIITVGPQYLNCDPNDYWVTLTGFPLTNVLTGQYDVFAFNAFCNARLTGFFTIQDRINRCSEFKVMAYSSSTGYTGVPYPFLYSPYYAIDQIQNTSGAIALTNYEARPYWEVRLLKPYALTSVVIFPYITGNNVPALKNFTGAVYDNNHALVYSGFVGTPNTPSHTLSFSAVSGRYIRIYTDGTGQIGLGEVQAFN